MSFCQLQLSCTDKDEADKIAKTLLAKQLIACSKQIPITSDFRWRSKIEHTKEVLLIMDSRVDLFEEVEAEVAKLHSYDTFVLQAIPLGQISKKAAGWLGQELS